MWRDSCRMGCAYDGQFMVCLYSLKRPQDITQEEFQNNVLCPGPIESLQRAGCDVVDNSAITCIGDACMFN